MFTHTHSFTAASKTSHLLPVIARTPPPPRPPVRLELLLLLRARRCWPSCMVLAEAGRSADESWSADFRSGWEMGAPWEDFALFRGPPWEFFSEWKKRYLLDNKYICYRCYDMLFGAFTDWRFHILTCKVKLVRVCTMVVYENVRVQKRIVLQIHCMVYV